MAEELKTSPRSLKSIALGLVRAYNDEEVAFKGEARELARWFEDQGEYDLAAHVMAQFGGAGTFSTMEIDPLPKVARDMYADIVEMAGHDSAMARGYRIRLANYMRGFDQRADG